MSKIFLAPTIVLNSLGMAHSMAYAYSIVIQLFFISTPMLLLVAAILSYNPVCSHSVVFAFTNLAISVLTYRLHLPRQYPGVVNLVLGAINMFGALNMSSGLNIPLFVVGGTMMVGGVHRQMRERPKIVTRCHDTFWSR